MENGKETFNLEDEYIKIQTQLENHLELLCIDLHSIRLAFTNFPTGNKITIPNPYISYFLKNKIDNIVYHTKNNIEQILKRVNNNFAFNLISTFELYIKQGYCLLLTLRKQNTKVFSGQSFSNYYKSEMDKFKTLGSLVNEIKDKLNSIDRTIIQKDLQYYNYFENYILLRNCLAHNNGNITEIEKDMEIRLPIITQEQLQDYIKNNKDGPIDPITIIKKWDLNDFIKLELNEVEGIAYGLTKVSVIIFKHFYKAADKHFEGLERAGR